jgi:hypothetical protein
VRAIGGIASKFFSRPRVGDPSSTDPVHGSADWLTHVIVTDDPRKLAELAQEETGDAETSFSSRRVTVSWWVGSFRGTRSDCLTVADEPLPPQDPFGGPIRIEVKTLDVLPGDADILNLTDEDLVFRWKEGCRALESRFFMGDLARVRQKKE